MKIIGIILLAVLFWSCTAFRPAPHTEPFGPDRPVRQDTTQVAPTPAEEVKTPTGRPQERPVAKPSPVLEDKRNFARAQTPWESLWQERYTLKEVAPAQRRSQAQHRSQQQNRSENRFTIQFETMVAFETAQQRRSMLQTQTGLYIQMVFEAPFYKLRGGEWGSREEAMLAAQSFEQQGLSAVVMRVP
jgi:hypothetical protein